MGVDFKKNSPVDFFTGVNKKCVLSVFYICFYGLNCVYLLNKWGGLTPNRHKKVYECIKGFFCC